MNNDKFDLFVVLLRLRSYLLSLIDDSEGSYESFEFTEEYLLRKYPDLKDEIIEILQKHSIQNDFQLTFDPEISSKLQKIFKENNSSVHLSDLLEKFNIQEMGESLKEQSLEYLKLEREQQTKEIVSELLHLAKVWTQRSIIENQIDDYTFLEEADVLRPEEEKHLDELDDATNISYGLISKLTYGYLELLIDHYFKYGGDVSLANFLKALEKLKVIANKKYNDLFKKYGLDTNSM